MSIMHDIYAEHFGCSFVEGGVASACGFSATGVHAGFREEPERADLALVLADKPCAAAGMFTQNVFCAAPVQLCREHLNEGGSVTPNYGRARAVLINSGMANAAMGRIGLDTAAETVTLLAQAIGCTDSEVLPASTGLIGVPLPIEPFEPGIAAALDEIGAMRVADDTISAQNVGGTRAASAIMTTDTHPKECAVTFVGDNIGYPDTVFTVGGMAKGSGMLMPQMATMIAVITTDAPLYASDLSAALAHAVNESFNKVTIDSDTSTNDSCFLLASGAAAESGSYFEQGSSAYRAFEAALLQVCTALARAIATDGEGATRLITVNVAGAQSDADADAAARTVANSPLVKTAIFGSDANWGRIAAALGHSGARFSQENVDIDIMGIPVCRGGLAVAFDEAEALARFAAPEIVIDIDLGAGTCSTVVWTCDLSHDYVTINGDYRT